MLTEEIIKQIAAEEAHHVCESGAPNAKQHNAKVVEQAIRRALAEVVTPAIVPGSQLTSDELRRLEHQQHFLKP